MNKKALLALISMAAAGIASAANINVSSDITTSQTWTSDNVYNLTKQIYVRPGATLTIPAGTLVQSTTGVGGSLAVSRGAKIYVNGTEENPVIMTSTSDDLVNWHEGCNEWGNLTLMGKGLISASSDYSRSRPSNTKTPTGLNVVQMEGLTADGINDVFYGGNDDNDDSGSISYLSLRYGGKVIGLANELNGLSLGGIGRETDIHHVEIMNNVDDGIEIWGGTVNLKYVNIWNIGDDSLDIDQGYRGKIQFGLIVQGYSTDDEQGSGLGDNCIEIDGAENSDAQPATTTVIANMTVIGNPDSGDGATTWRDNARVQYKNCIFMDIGEEVVRLDGTDGDGAQGYQYALYGTWNGTLNSDGKPNAGTQESAAFASLWTTPYDSYYTTNWITSGPYGTDIAAMYPVQTSGNMCEISGCLFNYVNESDSGDKVLSLGVLNGTSGAFASNTNLDNIVTTLDPIVSFQRGPKVVRGTKNVALVTNINPRAANDALVVASPVESDGFFTAAPYKGAFSANNNWLENWTAIYDYGMTTDSNPADPSATIQMTASTFFQTAAGVVYTVEESSDMKNWAPVATVTGDGSIMSATDLDAFNSAKFYRAIVL
jgi:hypothetical protein